MEDSRRALSNDCRGRERITCIGRDTTFVISSGEYVEQQKEGEHQRYVRDVFHQGRAIAKRGAEQVHDLRQARWGGQLQSADYFWSLRYVGCSTKVCTEGADSVTSCLISYKDMSLSYKVSDAWSLVVDTGPRLPGADPRSDAICVSDVPPCAQYRDRQHTPDEQPQDLCHMLLGVSEDVSIV